MYAFASLVVWKFAELSALGRGVELAAVVALEGYFGIAIATYVVLFYGAVIRFSMW
jgi:hypothetical protein